MGKSGDFLGGLIRKTKFTHDRVAKTFRQANCHPFEPVMEAARPRMLPMTSPVADRPSSGRIFWCSLPAGVTNQRWWSLAQHHAQCVRNVSIPRGIGFSCQISLFVLRTRCRSKVLRTLSGHQYQPPWKKRKRILLSGNGITRFQPSRTLCIMTKARWHGHGTRRNVQFPWRILQTWPTDQSQRGASGCSFRAHAMY